MNKMKKLLSVVLAVVLALSAFSIMGSAAKTNYRTVNELTALDAYSPYGQVTRLSLEERTSIVFDALDNLLPTLNINMGTVFDVLGLSVTIDLTSIDRLCYSFDTIRDTFKNPLASIAMGIVNLGILESLKVDTWETGMSRANTTQFKILSELLEFLSANTTLVGKVFTDGLDLGLINSMLGDIDMSSIEDIIMNLPGLVKGLVYPMIERWDDTLSLIKEYDNSVAGTGKNVEAIANMRVKKLFSDNMSITTIKYDVNGNMTSEHFDWVAKATGSAAPGTPSANSPRCYYQFSSTTPGSVMTVYHIVDADEAKTLAKTPDEINGSPAAYTYFKEKQTFVMSQEVEGSETYVWKATDEFDNTWSLKWYNDDSQFLDGFSGDDFDLATMSAGDLLYTFIPVVFENMAPVVLNGSVKKALAEFVGVKFTYVGQGGPEADDAVMALEDSSNAFFTQEQGEYLWEWSDYIVIGEGETARHYYRFEDQIFAGSLDNVNNYFDIINWNFKVTGDFMNEFIPSSAASADTRLLQNVTKFLNKVGNLVLLPSAETDDTRTDYTATWTRPTFADGNENLVNNIKALAQAIVGLAPQHIFGDDYATNERCYVELMLSDDNDTILTGIAAHLVNMIMPSMTLPGKSEILASGAKVGAILAAVVREFAAYLAPEYNFDALIYTSFENGKKTFVSGKDSGYWFDVILTMGINVGYEYLRAFADMGEGTDVWDAFVAYSGYGVDGKTYAAGTTQAALNAEWEGMLDYIVDWALSDGMVTEVNTVTKPGASKEGCDTTGAPTTETIEHTYRKYEWTWNMGKLVDTSGLTIDMKTAQDPFVKIEKILGSILPVSEILTVEPTNGEAKFEHWLRHDLILGIVDLKWDHLIDTIQFNGTNNYFRKANVLDQLAALLKGVVNSLFKKIGNSSDNFALIPAAITDFDSLATQANLVEMVKGLVGALYNAGVVDGGAEVLMPFLNFLLGWKTDPQELKDPVVGVQFRDDNDYALQWDVQVGGQIHSTYITFLNNSAGMLETHRNSSVTDHAYDINIKSVTFDGETNKDLSASFVTVDKDGNETKADATVVPYEKVWIKVNGTYKGEEAVTATIAYDYVGKDGKAIDGGTQYTSYTFLLSNQYEDANLDGRWSGDDDDDYTGTNQYKKFVFTEDLYTSVTTYEPTIFYVKPTVNLGAKSKKFNTICANGENDSSAGDVMQGQSTQYFEWIRDKNEAGWEDSISEGNPASGRLYKAKAGVTADTEFPYGDYDMGNMAVIYGGAIVFEVNFIYYNSYGIYDIYTENKDNGYNANQGVSADLWNAYNEAWQMIVYSATYPMMTAMNGNSATAYVTTIQPHIPDAIENFKAAKEAYEKALADAQASGSDASLPEYVEALRTEIDNDFVNGKEINFQDYEFYEYFNYNDVKEAAEELYRSYLAPEIMDTYYILGSGIREAELDFVIGYEKNKIIATGIEASRMANDQAAIDASIAAVDEWVMPTTSKLIVDDFTSRLAYYKQFLNTANSEAADHMKFLNKEIAFVEAQKLNEADYTEASWANYAARLAEAKAVAAGTDEFSSFNSRIYDVKYKLMVAYKNLLKKEFSLIEAGGTADLLENIAKANELFAALNSEDCEWTVVDGVEPEEAYAQLISALGYNYQAVYTMHDVEVQLGKKQEGELKTNPDGSPMMFNLYADSALEYAENDRPNNQNNRAKVDLANANLEAALANFEIASSEPVLGGLETGVVDVTNKYVYGVVAGTEDFTEFFSVENGTFEMVANEAGYKNGTGATLVVKDSKGEEVDHFTLVIFGDVNGDGAILGADKNAVDICLLANSTDTLSEAQVLAADVNGDGDVAGADKNAIDICLLTGDQTTMTVNPFVN